MELNQQDAFADLDFSAFKRKVKASFGLDLEAYKRPQMERRLRASMDKHGAGSFQQYFSLLQRDENLLTEFLDRVTINVSELFRNPDQFEVLRTKTLPELLAKRSTLSVWSAGCSCGAEAYSLAVLLDELAPGKCHSILATDIDDRMLARARDGIYQEHEARNLTGFRLTRYFERTTRGYEVQSRLKKMVEFRKHDLLKDGFRTGLDLIVCRNVVIYLTDEAKAVLYGRFFGSLAAGGYLFVGGTERIVNAGGIGFESRFPFFYRKPERH